MEIDVQNFDVNSFLQEHRDDYVVFVRGGWQSYSNKGHYQCLLRYGHYCKRISADLDRIRSSNVAMLQGAIAACRLLRKGNTTLYLITPTPLGFKQGQKGRGVNVELIQTILDVCSSKNITFQEIALHNGGDLIRSMINSQEGRML